MRGSSFRRRHCRLVILIVALPLGSACAAPLRRRPCAGPDAGLDLRAGSAFVEAKAHYGIPVLQQSIFWDGNGEVDDVGVGLRVYRNIADGWALGGGIVASNWFVSGADVQSLEAEGVLRCYPFAGSRLFLSGNTGFQQANDAIPPGGTEWNFTFGFGPGYDVPIAEHTSLLMAADYHHISNALGHENPHNPSQNEVRLWIGLGWNF